METVESNSRQLSGDDHRRRMFRKKLFLGLLLLAALTPIGVILPRLFRAEGAWGEWDVDYLRSVFGYVPRGLEATAGLWEAPLRDYAFPGAESHLWSQALAYGLSALAGLFLVALAAVVVWRMVKGSER
jgi:cobalt/nickel transport protein